MDRHNIWNILNAFETFHEARVQTYAPDKMLWKWTRHTKSGSVDSQYYFVPFHFAVIHATCTCSVECYERLVGPPSIPECSALPPHMGGTFHWALLALWVLQEPQRSTPFPSPSCQNQETRSIGKWRMSRVTMVLEAHEMPAAPRVLGTHEACSSQAARNPDWLSNLPTHTHCRGESWGGPEFLELIDKMKGWVKSFQYFYLFV